MERRPSACGAAVVLAALTVTACGAASHPDRHAASTTTAPAAPTTTGPAAPTTAAPVGSAAATGTAPLVIPTAASLVDKALANAVARQWAHIDVTTTSGTDVITFSQDSGPASGRQYITADGAHAEALLVGGIAYATGDATAVTNYFQYPASQAARLAGRWVSFSPRDPGFANVAEGITLASALSNDTTTGPYHVGVLTTIDGQQVLPISVGLRATGGGPGATGTLYITPGSSTLPVELDAVGSDGSKTTVRYSRWGVAVTVVAPGGAIPAASIPAS